MRWNPKDAEWARNVFASEQGQRFLKKLQSKRMSPLCDPIEHQAAYRLGAISGYETCLANILDLTIEKPEPAPAPQANYGVADKKESDKAAPA